MKKQPQSEEGKTVPEGRVWRLRSKKVRRMCEPERSFLHEESQKPAYMRRRSRGAGQHVANSCDFGPVGCPFRMRSQANGNPSACTFQGQLIDATKPSTPGSTPAEPSHRGLGYTQPQGRRVPYIRSLLLLLVMKADLLRDREVSAEA